MEDQIQQVSPQTPDPTPAVSPSAPKTPFYKKRKIQLIIGGTVAALAVVVLLILSNQKKGAQESDVIAKINGQPIYQSYVNRELEFYPGEKTAEAQSQLKEKVISDEIVLQGAKNEGLIADYPYGQAISSADYLQRTQDVKQVKNMIEEKADGISGEIVSIWFFNNDYVGPLGIEGGKQVALQKLTALHQRVQNKEISIKQAGKLIAEDVSLESIDPEYEPNSYLEFKTGGRRSITFWEEFNDKLWALKPDEITDIYLGSETKDGKTFEQLYLFGQVNSKTTIAGYSSFDEWFQKQKKTIQISRPLDLLGVQFAYAIDEDNGRPGGCGHGCPPWTGKVVTETGAPIVGATVTQKNCQAVIINTSKGKRERGPSGACKNDGVASRTTTTDADGNYSFIDAIPFNCGHNNHTFTASFESAQCSSEQMAIGNVDNLQNVPDLICRSSLPSPSPSASPSASPSPSPSPSPTPPPPSCNTICEDERGCFGAKDGCTSCLPNDAGTGKVCRPAPACNTACTRDGQCIGAKDGCIACIDGVCKVPPSCGTSCTTKAQCTGVRDGCSECLEGTCTNYNDNMCKCDSMVADMVYPGDSFNFEAFGKVEGADVKKAQIADVTFRMTKDNQVIAKSNPITPTIVESSANKLRVKASWSTPPPPVSKGSTYRVFADVRCKPKRIIASANEVNSPKVQTFTKEVYLKPPPGLQLITDALNRITGNSNKGVKLATDKLLSLFSTQTAKAQSSNLQLQTLNFVKVLDTDNCRFVMFKFDETLF